MLRNSVSFAHGQGVTWSEVPVPTDRSPLFAGEVLVSVHQARAAHPQGVRPRESSGALFEEYEGATVLRRLTGGCLVSDEEWILPGSGGALTGAGKADGLDPFGFRG